MDKDLCCDVEAVHDETVKKAKKKMLPDDEIHGLSVLFKIIGDPTRVRIVWALDRFEMCVCDLAAALDMTKSAISHQLSTLKQYHLVKSRRDGKNVFYTIQSS